MEMTLGKSLHNMSSHNSLWELSIKQTLVITYQAVGVISWIEEGNKASGTNYSNPPWSDGKRWWVVGGPAALSGAALAASYYHFKLVFYDICTKNVCHHSNRTLRAGTLVGPCQILFPWSPRLSKFGSAKSSQRKTPEVEIPVFLSL
jgi:hypothetical protein